MKIDDKLNELLISLTSEKQKTKFADRMRHHLPEKLASCLIQDSFPNK